MAQEKFHLSKQGPAPCAATERACPVGGQHYGSMQEAEAAFGKRHQGRLMPSVSKTPAAARGKQAKLQGSFTILMRPMKGDSYAGTSVLPTAVQGPVTKLMEHLGPEEYLRLKAQKDQRDGGDHYHMTLLAPQEVRLLKKEAKLEEAYKQAPRAPVEILGVGKAEEGEKIAYFAVCRSAEVEAWRERLGLPKKDLHVTLAFDGGDVHSQPKGEGSIIL